MPIPVQISAATDAHVDHFATFNLFGGTKGPYWSLVNAWNLGSLTNSDYSLTITNFACLFPNQTVMSWSFPPTANAANVYAYPEIVYGMQASGFITPATNPPPPTQVNAFNNLSVTYNIVRTFADNDSDCLIETWIFTTSTRTQVVNEVAFFCHTPDYLANYVLSFADHFNFSSGGFNAYIAAVPDRRLIMIMPVTAPNGTTPLDMTSGTQTYPAKAVLNALVSQAWVTGTNWVTGYEFGFEVARNSGTVLFKSIVWRWN